MNLFFDTSSLFKLYHQEADSARVETTLHDHEVETIFLSELTKIEFPSAIWKKWRTKELTEPQAKVLIRLIEKDRFKYSFVPLDSSAVNQAISLIDKYGPQGLRTLDGLQLVVAISVRTTATLFKSADKLLNSFFVAKSLPTA